MSPARNVLFPVDFSPSSVAMAAYVRRSAAVFGAKVSLLHVVDPASYSGLELYTALSTKRIKSISTWAANGSTPSSLLSFRSPKVRAS
jgi:nucleotide-binding universal stress UspA family protein